MKRATRYLLLAIPVLFTLQACSYIEAVKRAKYNETIKGTEAYYDNKCLVAEECAVISGKIILPGNSHSDTLAVAVVVKDKNGNRVIDFEVIKLTPADNHKVSYYFFDLPVGSYTVYTLTLPDQDSGSSDRALSVLSKNSGTITEHDLQPYQNVIIMDDVTIQTEDTSEQFPYTLEQIHGKLHNTPQRQIGYFEDNVNLKDPIFSHNIAMEGLYYPESFKKKTKPIYRLAPKFRKGTIPILFVHGLGGTPRDWSFMLENLNLAQYTPYLLYYPSGEDFTKLAAQYKAWILSDKIFEEGPAVIVAHSFGGIIVRDALNLDHKANKLLFITLATPFGGDAKATNGVKNAPYVLPSWRSIADDGDFIKNLYRHKLFTDEKFELIFAYNNKGKGVSGDGRVPLEKQLRGEAQNEAHTIRGFNEDHLSILTSKETARYVNTLLEAFAKENSEQK